MALETFCLDFFSGMLGAGTLGMTGDTQPLAFNRVTTGSAHGTFCPDRNMAHLTAIHPGHLSRNRAMHIFNLYQFLMTPSVHTPLGNSFSNRHREDANESYKKPANKQVASHLFFLLLSIR
jgi:hypothetical protein